MKRKSAAAGFSLIEVLAAITILGLITVPLGSALVLAVRLSERSDALLQARLQVNSAVESLMASGIEREMDDDTTLFPGLIVSAVQPAEGDSDESAYPAYKVTVTSNAESEVSVTTWIRPALLDPEGGDGG